MTGVQGQLLDLNVVGCRNLRDTEWFSRQDPYVVIKYANSTFRTKTDTDGGRNPSFNDKFVIPLIEGLREVTVEVWNSNTLTFDDFIGSGRIQLEKALSSGYDDTAWNLTSKRGKYAGELKVILHYARPQKASHSYPVPYQGYAAPAYGPPSTAAPYPAATPQYYPQQHAAPPCQHHSHEQYPTSSAYPQHPTSSAYPSYGYSQGFYPPPPAPTGPYAPHAAAPSYPSVYDAYAPYPPYR